MSRSVKVLFHARSADRETAWCAPTGKHDQYRLDNILFLHPRPCLDDVIETKEGPEGLVFRRVVKPSGRFTMVVDYPRRADFKVLVKLLRAKGVETEGMSAGRLYLAVPRKLKAKEVFALAAARVPGLIGVVPRLGPRPAPVKTVVSKPPPPKQATLFDAVERGDVKAIKKAKPAALKMVDRHGRSLLFAAVLDGQAEVVKALLARGMDPNPKRGDAPLYAAAMRNRPEEAKILLQAGAKPELAKDDDGDVALVIAAFRESTAVLRVLLGTGPSVAHLSHALLEAAGVGNVTIVKLLLKHGADPDLKTRKGNSARSIAQKRRLREVLALFAKQPRGTPV